MTELRPSPPSAASSRWTRTTRSRSSSRQQRRAARRRPRRVPRAGLGGEDVADDFEIERLAGKVRLREITTGFKIGPLRISTGHAPDLEIEVPRAAALSFRSRSGDVEAKGTAGESRWATASGDIRVQVDGGPVAVESMSGDVEVVATAPIELRARSVSGDLEVRAPGSTRLAASSTSGDIRVEAALGAGQDHVISSVSGDVELTTSSDVRLDTQTVDRRRARHRHPVRRGRPRPPDAGGRRRHGPRVGPDDLGRHPAARRRCDRGIGADATVPLRPVRAGPPEAPAAPVPPVARRAGAAGRRGRRGRGGPEPGPPGRRPRRRGAVRRREPDGSPRGRPARDPPRARARRPRHRVRIPQARDPRGRRPAVLPGLVLTWPSTRSTRSSGSSSEGRLTAEEAAPILAALDDRAGSTGGAPVATPPPSAGPGSEPPGGFGSNPPPSFAPGDASRAERGGGPSILRIEVRDAGRQVVNLRLPIAVGKFALDRIPGLPAEQVDRVREALRSGFRGSSARGRRRRRRRADRPRMTAPPAGRVRSLPFLRALDARDFRLLWASEAISLVGDQFHFVALSWLVISLTGSGLRWAPCSSRSPCRARSSSCRSASSPTAGPRGR